MPMLQTRRRFLTAVSLGAAAFGLPQALAAESPIETTSVRLPKMPSICVALQDIAEELLRAEGFTDIRYVPTGYTALESVARGDTDFAGKFAGC